MANVEDKQFETKNCPTRTTKVHHITRACKASFWTTVQRAASQKHVQSLAAKALHIPYRIYEARYINQRANYSASLFRTRGEFKL